MTNAKGDDPTRDPVRDQSHARADAAADHEDSPLIIERHPMEDLADDLGEMKKVFVCHCGAPASKYRRNTAYVDDAKNYSIACDDCQEEDCLQMQDMWADYYSGLL